MITTGILWPNLWLCSVDYYQCNNINGSKFIGNYI